VQVKVLDALSLKIRHRALPLTVDSFASVHHDADMRTTISLDDDLHAIASAIAWDQRKSLSAVVNGLLREALAGEPASRARQTRFPSFRTARKVTCADVRALEDES
jgi:hypothetical protein